MSDIARRRIAAVLLIVAIAVAVLAITDTGPLFDDPPTEEDRVGDVVQRFYSAAAEGDFATYCALLTPGARDRVRVNAARLLEEAGRLKCADILAVAKDSFAGISARIREVSVSGIRARAEVNAKVPGTPGVQSKTMFLDQDDAGEWLVSDPGS